MTREELIQLGNQIIEETDDDRQEELMERFDRNVPHPRAVRYSSIRKTTTPALWIFPPTTPLSRKW